MTPQDIQSLHDGDSVAAFLTRLGYDTRARIPQTAANLGIPEPVQKRIKRIELLADHDKFLQIYLFELKSVTVADIKAIGRAFRDKAGNFLFVITSDYDFIEFVLLDRIGKSKNPTAISTSSPQRSFRGDLVLIGATLLLFIVGYSGASRGQSQIHLVSLTSCATRMT